MDKKVNGSQSSSQQPANSGQHTANQSDTDVLGIISLVLFFFMMPFIGLILAIVGMKKAKDENRSNTLSKIGVILNAIGLVIGLLIALLAIIALIKADKHDVRDYEPTRRQRMKTQTMRESKDYAKGETAQFGDFKVKASLLQRGYTAPNNIWAAKDGEELVVVDMEVTNTSDRSQYFSYSTVKIDSGSGMLGDYSLAKPPGEKLQNGQIISGSTVKGQVVYAVKAGATELKLRHEDRTIDRNNGYRPVTITSTLTL